MGGCRIHDRFVEQNNEATAAAATVADDDARAALLADLLAQVAGCFPRRETRQTCAQMVNGLLMEDQNCWTIAEAIGYRRPYRLHHFLSRAVRDEELLVDAAAGWAADRLGDGDGVLIIDETGDGKSSADAAGAARQYSGSVGGVALCQVMVTLTYATGCGHTLLGRALYLPDARAADEEHRELTGIPDEVMFATRPELAGGLAEHALELLVRRHRYTRKLSFYRCWTSQPAPLSRLIHVATVRWRIEEDHQIAKQTAGLYKGQVTCWSSWHRWTAICLLAYIFLTVAAALERRRDGAASAAAQMIDVTVPELLRLLRGTVIPPPCRDRGHVLDWSHWRREHQHRARQAHQRWNAYADAVA